MKSIQEQAEAQALAFVKSYGSAYETNREKQGGVEAYEKGYVAGASPLQAKIEGLQAEVNRLRVEMRKVIAVCEGQERDWRSIEDDDNAKFWHGLKNDIERSIYPSSEKVA